MSVVRENSADTMEIPSWLREVIFLRPEIELSSSSNNLEMEVSISSGPAPG